MAPHQHQTLKLWLPGYHTPSLNVTKGGHWKQYLGLKQQAARALEEALPDSEARAKLVLDAIAKGGRAGAGGKLVRKAAKQEAERSRRAAKAQPRAGKTLLTYIRVTTRPLDPENLCGSTKALTDVLRQAFPNLLPDDSAEHVRILHEQERCTSKCEEGTWIEIYL